MTLPKLQMTLVSPTKVGLAIRSTSAIAHGKWKVTTPAYYTNTVWVQEFERAEEYLKEDDLFGTARWMYEIVTLNAL